MFNSSLNYSDLDELISDKGITYNNKNCKLKMDNILSESRESYNEELFEHFKQFIHFQRMREQKNKTIFRNI